MTITPKQTKIIIVEDDELQAEYIRIHLDELKYNVIDVVDSGEKAVEAVKKYSPDLIIMDIFLSGEMNGIQAASEINSFTDTPIIYITTQDSDEIFNQAKSTSPYAYLLKPFTSRELELITELSLQRYRAEKKILSYHAHLSQAQQLGNMGSWEWDIITNDLVWSDHIFRIYGLEPQIFIPTYTAFLERIHPDDKQVVIDAVNDAVSNNKPYDIEHRIILPNGKIRSVHEVGAVDYDNNKPLRMIGTVIDITSRKEIENEIEHLAYYDDLTDLANRRLLLDRLNFLISVSKRNKSKFALLFVDLDGFKTINDIYGHKEGDKVLQKTAKNIKSIVREMDTVARIGGDEFIVLISDLPSKNAAMITAEKIITKIKASYNIHNDTPVSLTASIGIAMYPEDGQNADTLLTNSDTAMYSAKNTGKNKACFYKSS